jgi:hypothetical protein
VAKDSSPEGGRVFVREICVQQPELEQTLLMVDASQLNGD